MNLFDDWLKKKKKVMTVKVLWLTDFLGEDEKDTEHWSEVWLLQMSCDFPDKMKGLAN